MNKTIGTYTFDFSNNTFSTVSEDIEQAFYDVDGIKTETQAPAANENVQTTTEQSQGDENEQQQ